jgi:hypothetical protein
MLIYGRHLKVNWWETLDDEHVQTILDRASSLESLEIQTRGIKSLNIEGVSLQKLTLTLPDTTNLQVFVSSIA